MADKCIGKLTLDISDVSKKIEDVNKFLGQIGANINLEDKLSKKISDALRGLVNEAKKAGEEASKAIEAGTAKASGNNDNLKNAIKLWREYYNVLAQAENALKSNNTDRFNDLRREADDIRKRASALREEKEVLDETAAARRRYETAYSNRVKKDYMKEETENAKALSYSIKEATEARKAEEKAAEAAAQQAQKEIQERDKLTQMYRQMFDEIDARNAKTLDDARAQQLKNEQAELDKLIKLYLEYFDYKTKAVNANASNNTPSETMYNGLAQNAYNEILQYNEALRKTAEESDKVTAAQTNWINAINNSAVKDAANATKDYENKINDYKNALVAMLNEQAKFNQQVASGRLVAGTEQYSAAEEKLKNLESAAIQAGQKLDQAGRDAAMGMQEVKVAVDNVNVSLGALNDSGNVSPLTQVENAYKQLTQAIRDYNLAKKANNEEGMAFSQNQINSAMQTISLIEKGIDELNIDAATRERIREIIAQTKIQQDAFQKGITGTTQATGELESQVKGLVTRYMSLMAVIRMISSLMSNMVEYVSEYSDKMNEIQMITMKTDSEVARLAETYRGLAKDMSVSSLDMADAAIYFTRQGLEAEQIEDRLKNVTMYAKAANVEFKDASEIITAVVNSMGLVEQEAEDGREAAQRVADVFLNIGDNAATSGQEIGEAMQKAAASAGAFGISMEWLAAYIATVSETTRQEARTIGTAFNTIIARLHQIKQTGYNQEDETKVNDIAKALSKIDVVLMDQAGNWRDMETILEEIADKWGNLDGKTRSYIATTMAGVKQQNVFLALMNDMSKGVEKGSRAFELHEKAMNSDGVAAEKYAVYLDSVTAAQERLTIAQENFYAILSQDVVKGWYDTLAGITNFITDATKAMGGLNIILPIAAGGIALVVAGIQHLAVAITEAGTASAWFAKVWTAHPVLLAITGVTLAITALTGISGALSAAANHVNESFNKANESLSKSEKQLEKYAKVQSDAAEMFSSFGNKVMVTAEDLDTYNSTLEEIANISPIAKHVVDELKAGFISQQDAAKLLNEELERLVENEKKISMQNLIKRYANYTGDDRQNSIRNLYSTMGIFSTYDDQTAFKYAVQSTYNNNELDSDLKDYIDGLKEAYKSAGLKNDKIWEEIANAVALELFGSADASKDITKVMVDHINEEIDKVMSVIGSDLDPSEFIAVRQSLYNAIFGEDGELDPTEYNKFASAITKWLSDFAINGKDQIISEMSDVNIAEAIAGTLFDESYFGDLFKNKGEEFSRNFVESYKELIKQGFSADEIASVLTGMSQDAWDSAARVLREKLQRSLQETFGTDFLGQYIYTDDGNGNLSVSGKDSLMWDQLDTGTLNLINDMAKEGIVSLDEVNMLMIQAKGNVDDFKKSLQDLGEAEGFVVEDVDVDELFNIKPLKELVKDINASVKDIRAIDAAIKNIQENKDDINYSDILGLAEAHPELLTVIGDTNALLEALKKIRTEASANQRNSIRGMILGEEKAMAGSKYADSGYSTLLEYRHSLTSQEEIDAFDAEIEKMIDGWQKANEDAKKVAKETKAEVKASEKAFSDTVKEVESLDKMIEKLQSNKKVDFSDLVDLSIAHPEIMAFAGDADKLIEKLQEIRAEAKESVKDKLKNYMLNSEDYYQQSEYYDPHFRTMSDFINTRDGAGQRVNENWKEAADSIDQAAQNIVDAAERTEGAAESWLEAQAKIAEINEEVNWAKSNNFEDQINALQGAIESGGIESAIELFESWSEEMQKAVGSEYPAFIKAMGNAKKAMKEQGDQTEVLTKQTKEMKAVLASTEKLNNVKYFTDTAGAIKKLSNGTISATDAIEVYHKEVNKVTKAYEDILDVQNKMEYNEKEAGKGNEQSITGNDVQNLANLLNMTTEQVLADFPAAVDMFDQLTSSTGELADMLNQLSAASFIKITGTSEADFTNLQNGLISIQGMAKETIEQLEKTGLWTVETIKLDTEAWVQNADGTWTSKYLQGYQEILKPTSNNPLSGRTGGTGVKDNSTNNRRSGGGGSSKDKNKNSMTEVERALDVMSQVNTIQEGQQGYYQSQQKYYQQTGQLQGVIAYMQRENDVLKNQNVTLEGNIQRIEAYMEKKRAELATLSITDEAYEEVADDLDRLQKAHQTYTKQLVDNKTAMDALTKSIKEQNDKIRQMEIDLRNTILKAIEDRERRTEDMMNAEIEMENKILDLITRRYERERDEIIETTNRRIDLLNEEKNLLSEQLQMRKEQADEEDKLTKLKELEVKYQRIVADPTRRKEALSIRKDIDDLRKEMAWDAAEKEVKAQQDALDKQITNLEDYITYVEEYYEDLFEHPVKLIEEMKSIIEKSDAEIIEWLKTNEEEYARSTENTQAKMVSGWQDTLDAMRGLIKTYWDEVEQIISQGDEYIIEFLKANSQDYREAGKLQGEAYVDEWKEQLENLKKAHQQVAADIAASYDVIQKSETSASSKSGGGGGGGGSKKSTQVEDHGYSFVYGGKTYAQNGFSTKDVADAAMKDAVSNIVRMSASAGGMSSSSMIGQGIRLIQSQATVYKDGGLADFTGPAWLDGTKQNPERILNPYQTKLFESMVQALERMSTISIPGMPDFGGMAAGGNPVSVGDIVVNVENLDTDDDYEELAQKVSEILMDRIGRTAVVGGMRISSF